MRAQRRDGLLDDDLVQHVARFHREVGFRVDWIAIGNQFLQSLRRIGGLELVDADTTVYQAQAALESALVDRAMAGLLLRRAAGLLDPDAYLK